MIDDFQYVCITCRDLERSIRFYETLGLTVIERPGEVKEEGIARAFKLPSIHLDVVHLAPPNKTSKMFIDQVQWIQPPATGDAYPVLNNIGLNRLAFRVSDLDETTAALRKRGIVFFTDEPQSFDLGYRRIVTVDPDGVFIQLLEQADPAHSVPGDGSHS